MAKPKPIQISIPKSCSQNWDEMTPSGNGKFCDHCQKTVIDFTNWTDTALYEFFAKSKNENVCGKFKSEQINRNIIPFQPHSRLYRIFIGLGLTLMLSYPTQSTFAKAPITQINLFDIAINNAGTDEEKAIQIRGVVFDDNGYAIIGASVGIVRLGTLKYQTITNVDGSFLITVPSTETNIRTSYLAIYHPSYSGEEYSLRNLDTSVDVYMEFKLRGAVLGGAYMIFEPVPLVDKPYHPGISEKQIKKSKK